MSIREIADGRQVSVLTRDDIRKALREYAALYGDDFPQSAFAPSQAKRNGRPDLVELYYRPRADGSRWPSLNAIKSKYDGSWNAARADAGFGPNSTGPASGRRARGEAEPILHVRERLVYVPAEKTREAVARARRLEDRLEKALARAQRAEAALRERPRPVREPRPVPERPPVVTRVETRVVTKTKTVKVKDERALERLRSRLADAEAARRAVQDQLRSEQRDRNREKSRFAELDAAVQEAHRALSDAERDRDRALDRLVASEALTARLRAEIDEVREQAMGVSEAAVVADLVRQADRRADLAEVRAARAEREMAEQAAAITGETRKLTQAELVELRARGPAGPAVLAAALKGLAKARARNSDLDAALLAIARAAMTWRDRLG